MKKITCLLCAAIACLMLAACASEAQPFEPDETRPSDEYPSDEYEAPPEELYTPLVLPAPEGAVMYIDGEAVSSEEFCYQLVSTVSAYEYYAGEEIDWTGELEGKPAAQFFLDETASAVIRFRAIEYGAAQLDMELSDDELAQIDSDIANQAEQMGGQDVFDAALAAQALNMDIYRYLVYVPQLYYNMYTAYYGEGGECAPSADALLNYYLENYMTAQHIMVALFDEDGEPLDEAEQAAAEARLHEAYERAVSGEDFYSLMQEYSEDEWMETESITFMSDMMPEQYSDAVKALEPGELSEIFQIEDMLVFIKRLPVDTEYFNTYSEELYEEYASLLFDERIRGWMDALDVEYADSYSEIDPEAIYAAYLG